MPIHISTSLASEGSMKPLSDKEAPEVAANRAAFLEKTHIRPDDTTLLNLIYEGDNYRRYVTLAKNNKGDGIVNNTIIVSDALVVTETNHAILLPLADCIGAVLHDPTRNVLMVSHLGRHNLEQNGGTESVIYLVKNHNVDPKNLQVWLSPAAGRKNYPLLSFDNLGMHEVAIQQLLNAGVEHGNITSSPIDTTIDQNYFSHSQFLKGARLTDDRFCIVAVIR